MAKVHGKSAYFAVGLSSDDTVTDLSSFLNSIERSVERETANSTGFSPTGGFMTYVAGLQDGTISISGQYDGAAAAVDEILAALLSNDVARSWAYGPEGNGSGKVKYSGGSNGGGSAGEGVFLTSYGISSPLEDVVTFTAEFQITGQMIRGTF